MVGFLSYIAGGALKGAGDAMVLKAQQDRQSAILAWQEANKRTDMQSEFAHQDTSQERQIGASKDLETNRETFEGGQTDKQLAAHHADVQSQEAGAASRSQAEIAGRHQDVKTQTDAQIQSAQLRAGWENNRVNAYAQRYASGGHLTYAQALNAARAAFKDNNAQGIDMKDEQGNNIPAESWISGQADRLMQEMGGMNQPVTTTSNGTGPGSVPDYSTFGSSASLGGGMSGGGLLNPGGQSVVAPQPATGAPAGPGGSASNTPSTQGSYDDAVKMLQSNPKLAPLFDQRYGQGASSAALQGSAPQQ